MGRIVAYLALALIGALLASCGEESSQATDIDQVLLSEPAVVEVTSRSAVVEAVTTVDTVCAVAYGPTTSYGRISADSEMSVSGHRDHHHLLVGLEPDTSYHYMWGLVAPDGTVFRSRDLTFRTAPVDGGALPDPTGENLALLLKGARVAGASSVFGASDGAWEAANAIDGDPSTQWSSAGDGDDGWIEIELPSETHVTAVGFWTRTMGTSGQVFSFRVITDRGEVAGPYVLDDAAAIHYFPTDLEARRLRFENVETSGSNTGALEIEVYGEPVP